MSLSDIKRTLLLYIHQHSEKNHSPPSFRDIMIAHNYTSPNSAKAHVDGLIRGGYLSKIPGKARSIYLTDKAKAELGLLNSIPLLGKVCAGTGVIPQESCIEQLPKLARADFGLKVSGESMIRAGINDGDIVYVDRKKEASDGDIVVALVDDEATVKFFFRNEKEITLSPANELFEKRSFSGSELERIQIVGIVVSLIRRY